MKNTYNFISIGYLSMLLFMLPLAELQAQNPFDVLIEPIEVPNLGGLQSYAYGQAEGKWLIVGGRLDGLHRRQPFAAFDIAGHNNQLIVVDPQELEVWTAALDGLPVGIAEQLSATNINFHQNGKYLYCTGGYGYSAVENDHTTYPYLTAIDVPAVIDAIINGSALDSYFRQISDPKFQVAGGRLKRIDDRYYLVGGQKFIGRYNPIGPNHGPGFIQEYTNAIRIFELQDDGQNITINHLPSFVDVTNLHRRDFNVEAQIMPDGMPGLTAFSGVFKDPDDLPFLDCVNIRPEGYAVQPDFQQYYNHYHCPTIPLYSAAQNEMHTLFFGGIAQYFVEDGVLMQNDDVPFVKTIARVTRSAEGDMAEYKLPIEMPALLGAGAEFIPNPALDRYPNEVIKLDALTDTTLLGYIYGGISSSAANIFFINNGTESVANHQLFKVYAMPASPAGTHALNGHSARNLRLEVFPNPTEDYCTVAFELKGAMPVLVSAFSTEGQLLQERYLEQAAAGAHALQLDLTALQPAQVVLIQVQTPYTKATAKLVVE